MFISKCPKTIEEAKAYRYGKWCGSNGFAYDQNRCAYEPCGTSRGSLPSQCRKKPGNGPAGLYCSVHAKKIEEDSKPLVPYRSNPYLRQVSQKAVYKVMLGLVRLNQPSICRHLAACDLLSMMESEGIQVSGGLAKALVDSSAGDADAEKIIQEIIKDMDSFTK